MFFHTLTLRVHVLSACDYSEVRWTECQTYHQKFWVQRPGVASAWLSTAGVCLEVHVLSSNYDLRRRQQGVWKAVDLQAAR